MMEPLSAGTDPALPMGVPLSRQQRRAAEREAAKQKGQPPSFVEHDGERFMRLQIEKVGVKGYRIRQCSTQNFLRGPRGTILYFTSEDSAKQALETLRKRGEDSREIDNDIASTEVSNGTANEGN